MQSEYSEEKTNSFHGCVCAHVCYGFDFEEYLISTPPPSILFPELSAQVKHKPKARFEVSKRRLNHPPSNTTETAGICVRNYFKLIAPVECPIYIYLRVINEINFTGKKKRDWSFFHLRKLMLLIPHLYHIFCILPTVK